MKNPAEAARDPFGPTHVITGTGEERMPSTISRIESTKPPGVSRRRITARAPISLAWFKPSFTYAALTGCTTSARSISTILGADAGAELWPKAGVQHRAIVKMRTNFISDSVGDKLHPVAIALR